jgi:hypothetical protein
MCIREGEERVGLTLSASSDNLGLSDPLRLGGRRERLLELDGEVDVLDKDALNLDSPVVGDAFDDGLDLGSSGLSVRENLHWSISTCDEMEVRVTNRLEVPGSDNVPQRRLRTLDEGETDVTDSKRGLVGVDDVVVND